MKPDSKITAVYPDSELFKSCITALANNEFSFKVSVGGVESYCEIIKYKIFDIDYVNSYRTKYECIDLLNDFTTPVYVCGRNTICDRDKHRVSSVMVKAYNLKKTKIIDIIVSKCNNHIHHNKPFLFILYTDLQVYESKYGTLLFNHVPDASLTPNDCFERAKYHKMALNGYSVKEKKGLTDEERHNLLRFFVDTGIVPYVEIQSHLSFLIDQGRNNPKHQNSIPKWLADWDYIKKYVCEKDTYNAFLTRDKTRIP